MNELDLAQEANEVQRREEKILAVIAKIGFPATSPQIPGPPRRRRTLKSVVLSVQFLLRAEYVPPPLHSSALPALTFNSRRSVQDWEEKREVKHAVNAALDDVRKNRPNKKNKGKQRALS